MPARLSGLVILAVGTALSYVCVYTPLAAAARHEHDVPLHLKGVIVCPLILVYGILYLLLGERVKTIMGTREEPNWVTHVAGGLLLAAGLGLYLWLNSALDGMGYD